MELHYDVSQSRYQLNINKMIEIRKVLVIVTSWSLSMYILTNEYVCLSVCLSLCEFKQVRTQQYLQSSLRLYKERTTLALPNRLNLFLTLS